MTDGVPAVEHGLLSPGLHRAAGVADDRAVLAAMVRVEVAWLRALGRVGAVPAEDADALAAASAADRLDLDGLRVAAEDAGNPVVPLVARLRDLVGGEAAGRVHRGLTSQDVVDTALVLVAREALRRVGAHLGATADALARLAEEHRGSVMAGRTLTQWAVPVTFGLTAARWLAGVLDAADEVDRVLADLPVQCGGAAGTLDLVAGSTDPVAAARAFADELGLRWPGAPWHTRRTPITRVAGALTTTTDALGVVAGDVALLSRPELAEVREGAVAGRGGSSTMPHKRNPVLSVLVRSAALQAPAHLAQLHVAAALAVDERPDGPWHAEWPALRRLLELAVTAASQAAELVAGLEVDAAAMRARAEAAAGDLLAESGGGGRVEDHLGATPDLIAAVLARHAGRDRGTHEEDEDG